VAGSLGDQERMRVAEDALAGCVLDRQVACLLTDDSLCHGWAGVVQTLWRAASDALDPRPLQVALREARRGMEDHLARVGPPVSAGLLEGRSGIMLVQNDLPRGAGEPPAWDACFLLTL
jgi:hypothetical protein